MEITPEQYDMYINEVYPREQQSSLGGYDLQGTAAVNRGSLFGARPLIAPYGATRIVRVSNA